MFIRVSYKDDPELSTARRSVTDLDLSVEKILLVNPECYVRTMMEYIRLSCNLGIFTSFDLCDETGNLKGLFSYPTYFYPNEMFDQKKIYYVVVLKREADKRLSILPQLNRQNRLYQDLKSKVWTFTQQNPGMSPQMTPPSASTKQSVRNK